MEESKTDTEYLIERSKFQTKLWIIARGLSTPQKNELADLFIREFKALLSHQKKTIRAEIIEIAEPYDNAKWHNNLSVKQVLSLPSLTITDEE